MVIQTGQNVGFSHFSGQVYSRVSHLFYTRGGGYSCPGCAQPWGYTLGCGTFLPFLTFLVIHR